MKNLKAKLWRIYYCLFTDKFEGNTLREVLNFPYAETWNIQPNKKPTKINMMENRKVTIINKTNFPTKDIKEIVGGLLEGQLAPSFYLICEDVFSCKGISLTNLDKPTIIIFVKDLGQFAETFVHELTHIQQHSKNYTDENEAIEKEREIVIN